MKIRSMIVSGILSVTAAVAILVGTGTTPAFAGTGNQWAYEFSGPAYLNAWGGGPWVKVWESPGTPNNDFTLVYNHAYGAYQLEFTGYGASGECIGDAYNDPNNGYTSLDPCGFTGGAGWGTLLDLWPGCTGASRCFQDAHWSAKQNRPDFLGPPNGFGNGTTFILNSTTADNFYYQNPA